MTSNRRSRVTMRTIALGYLAVLLVLPVGFVFYRTFQHGLAPVWSSISQPDALHALYLTLVMVIVAVPLNAAFGVVCALLLVRHDFRGKALLNGLIDLPFAVSPVIIGLSLVLVYGESGWLGGWLTGNGFQIIFALPGMVLATVFVSLPFVVREVAPVLKEIGTEQEQAASTLGASGWQTFWRVTLPAIRWGLAYGIVLSTARALGEFGAVSIVSGKLVGQTETLPLRVDNQFQNFDVTGAYAAAVVLAVLALSTLFAMSRIQPRELDR
ncbi:MAG: sulfate/thiosulfate transport system permease protein [Solirubrobacterales bacterium]|nr:sulfate/thiosulfate transport system permease protein [Solirubrobacterales bacterium]